MEMERMHIFDEKLKNNPRKIDSNSIQSYTFTHGRVLDYEKIKELSKEIRGSIKRDIVSVVDLALLDAIKGSNMTSSCIGNGFRILPFQYKFATPEELKVELELRGFDVAIGKANIFVKCTLP